MTDQGQLINFPVAANLPFFRQAFILNGEDLPSNEILVAGLDPGATEEGLKKATNCCSAHVSGSYSASALLAARMAGSPECTTIGRLKFGKPSAVSTFLKSVPCHMPLNYQLSSCFEAILVKRLSCYKDPVVAQKTIDEFMETFDRKTLDEKSQKNDTLVDDEGFTIVTGNRVKSAEGCGVQSFKSDLSKSISISSTFVKSTDASFTLNPKNEKKKKKGGVEENFYRFQIREKKQQEYETLKRQKEIDSNLIEEMSKTKRFKLV